MVLDGNLDPVTWTSGNDGLPSGCAAARDQAAAANMRAFLDLCGQAPTTACAFSAGTRRDPGQVRHAAAPAARSAGDHRHPGADLYLRRRDPAVARGQVSQWQSDGAALLQQLWQGRRKAEAPLPPRRRPPNAPGRPAPRPPATRTPARSRTSPVLCADSDNPRDPPAYPAAARLARGPFGRFRA